MAGSIEKRIEILEARVNLRGARLIGLEVDGNLPDDEAAIDALLAPLNVGRQDTVIAVRKFVCTEGLPRIGTPSYRD